MRPFLVLLLVLVAACAHPPPTPDAPLIDDLDLEGTKAISEGDTKKRILTTESSWWPVWLPVLGDAQYFDPSAWQADLKRIERYYQTRGYYLAKVVSDEVKETKKGHVEITAVISEGPAFTIETVKRTGLEDLPAEHRDATLKKLPLEPGQVFEEPKWDDEKNLIASRLRELGYAEVVVTGEAKLDVATAKAELLLEVAAGRRYKFGKIYVVGEAQVPRERIAEQAGGAITPGDWYSESALVEAQALVTQMGVFGAVKVNRSAPDRELGIVPVVVDVREAPFHTVRFGGGFGLDQVRQEARLVGEFTHRNFLGGLRRFTVRGKLGYAFLPSIWDVASSTAGGKHGPVARVLTELEQPRIFFRSLSAQVSLDLSSGLEQAYAYTGGTAKLGFIWRPTSTITVFPSYNLDLYFLTSQVPLGGTGPEALFGCPAVCAVSYLEQTVEWDRRDSRLEPKTGTYFALSLQEGGGPVGGIFPFFRVSPEARGYLSFGEQKKVTVATRLRLGTLLSFRSDGETPILSRFFSGGSGMRGFATRRLSPLLAIARSGATVDPATGKTPAETLPIGGKGLLEASLEVRWNVWGDLVLAVFGDAGAVTADSLTPAGFGDFVSNIYTAVGFGARYRTPLGPIRVDLAFRLPIGKPLLPTDPTLDFPVNTGCFGLGGAGNANFAGSPEGLCAFHLSIGEAF